MLVLLLPARVAQADTSNELLACRQIPDATARLACYDRIEGSPRPSTLSTGRAAAADTAARAPDARAATEADLPSPVELFGRDATVNEALIRRATGIAQIAELQEQVAGAGRTPDGKLRITLDNGQVWQQIDTRRTRLKAGDAIVIRRAALGSYQLFAPGAVQGIRVRRLD